MRIDSLAVERVTLVSSKPLAQVAEALDAAIGHPDMQDFWSRVAEASSWPEVERVVHSALGPAGFMEFTRFDHGQFLKKDGGASEPHIVRLVLGNPLIMKQMARHVPDAGSYAPVTVLLHERPDGTHISYDRMASYLASYGNLAALSVARDLDAKVEALLTAAAG